MNAFASRPNGWVQLGSQATNEKTICPKIDQKFGEDNRYDSHLKLKQANDAWSESSSQSVKRVKKMKSLVAIGLLAFLGVGLAFGASFTKSPVTSNGAKACECSSCCTEGGCCCETGVCTCDECKCDCCSVGSQSCASGCCSDKASSAAALVSAGMDQGTCPKCPPKSPSKDPRK
jgi:hypothetical protein